MFERPCSHGGRGCEAHQPSLRRIPTGHRNRMPRRGSCAGTASIFAMYWQTRLRTVQRPVASRHLLLTPPQQRAKHRDRQLGKHKHTRPLHLPAYRRSTEGLTARTVWAPAPRRRSLESPVLLDFRRSFYYLLAPDQTLALRFAIASKLTMPMSPTMGGSNAYRALEALRSNSSTLLFFRVRKCPAYPVRPNRTRTATCRSTGAI